MRKLRILLSLIVIAIICIAFYVYPKLDVINGYSAKRVCSSHFISERPIQEIKEIDLEAFPLGYCSIDIDSISRQVSASFLGLKPATALYRKGLGCSLIIETDDYKISRLKPSDNQVSDKFKFPKNSLTNWDSTILNQAFDLAFDEKDRWDKKTKALIVIHRDSLVKEHYASGYTAQTKQLGWSMTKSIANLLVGILIKNEKISLDEDNLYPEWENDERSKINIEDLLTMSSGLNWTEEYAEVCDITQGLYEEEDFVRFARSKQLEFKIGEIHEYASGTTNLLSGIIRRRFEAYQSYLDFPHDSLFSKLGIENAFVETDEAGNYLLSSYMYARPIDWAKLGQLYLNQGHWYGEQIIDASYMRRSSRPSAADENYGFHVFLNTDRKLYPSLPSDAYKFSGYEGQYVFIIPSLEMVIVRMGMSKGPPFDMDGVLSKIIASQK